MITPSPLEVIQNNYGQQVPFALTDGNGNIVDLTGASLALSIQNSQDPTQTDITLGGSVSIDNPTAGTCHYTIAQNDFPTAGTFLVQLTANWSGMSTTWTGLKLIVLPQLPRQLNS